MFRRDLSSHNGMTDFLFLKEFQQPTQLANAHPFHEIDVLIERWIGFTGERRGADFLYSGFARRVGQQSRVNTVSRDDSEDFGRFQWSMFAWRGDDVDLTSAGGA